MIVTMFPEPREQAKAIGVFGFVASAGASIGLLVGGVLTQSINWHWIFFVNIPIGIATAMAAMRLLEKDKGIGPRPRRRLPRRGPDHRRADARASTRSSSRPPTPAGPPGAPSGSAAVAVALLVAFLVRESTAREPLIPLRIFRSRNVSGANAIQALFVAGMFGMFFMGALYLQRVLGYDALQTGLAFLPSTIVMGTLSLRYSERLIMRFGARTTLIPGLVLGIAGLLLFTRAPVDGSYVEHVLPVMVLLGAGAGISFPALMTLSMSGATPSDAGLASGLVNTTLQVGGALGLAVLATLSATRTERLRAAGDSAAAALNGGYHLAYLVGAGLDPRRARRRADACCSRSARPPQAVEAKPKRAPRRRPEPAYDAA